MNFTSEELFEDSKKIVPGGVHSPVRAFQSVGGTPVFFKEAKGATLTSVEGRSYWDFCQSFGPLMLGHRDEDVSRRVHEMVDTAWCLGTCEPYSLQLAQKIIKTVPWIEKIRFVSSGTEAVMSALRLARAHTGRSKVIKFDGCYHGHVDSMLVRAGSGLAGLADSDSLGVSTEVASQTLVAPLDDEHSLDQILEREGKSIAAIIIEPLPANYGLLEQRHEFLKFIESRARRHGAVLIFDEVISGFRVAMGGMSERLSIVPDLVTYGKVIGGGMNVGAVAGPSKILNQMAPLGKVYQAGTLSANPIAMVAGLATLEKISERNVISILEKRGIQFRDHLNRIFEQWAAPFRVNGLGSIFWIHGVTHKPLRKLTDIPQTHASNFRDFYHCCLREGIYLAPSGYEVGFLSFAHTEEVLDQTLQCFNKAVQSYVQR